MQNKIPIEQIQKDLAEYDKYLAEEIPKLRDPDDRPFAERIKTFIDMFGYEIRVYGTGRFETVFKEDKK